MAAALEIRNIVKRFGAQNALDDVTFEIPQSGVFGLLGPNGAGKTTLFSIIAGFLKPTRGTISVLGYDIENISALRGRLSILPQDALFQSNVPILEQLVFLSQLNGNLRVDAEREAMKALELVGLAESARKNARILSHGMTKRLGIAQAFLGKPEVILLDEPTAGLDPSNAAGIRQLVRSIQTTATLIVSSHDMREMQEMCSRVAILDRGKLVSCDSVSNITQANRRVRMTFARALAAPELAAVQGVTGVTGVTSAPDFSVAIELDPSLGRTQEEMTADIVTKLVAFGLVPRSVSDGDTLEARFLAVTTPQAR
jgi:ABC-2 type transport system ATP-binding protein